MNEKVISEILRILKESYIAIKADNVKRLKDLSNNILHSASIYQDDDAITILVLIYSLSKIFERTNYRSYKDWTLFYETCSQNLRIAEFQLKNNNIENYEKAIKTIFDVIDRLESNLKRYAKEILHKAQIVKGSRLYEHGISIGKTAELLGIDIWELMEYSGGTGIAEVEESYTMPVEKRLRLVRGIFK